MALGHHGVPGHLALFAAIRPWIGIEAALCPGLEDSTVPEVGLRLLCVQCHFAKV